MLLEYYFFGFASVFGAGDSGAGPSVFACSFAIFPPWLTNFLVWENSPSLWPTIFSTIKTDTWTLPLCTPIVYPTISGVIVQDLSHVFTTTLSVILIFDNFSSNLWFTYGPFLSDRDIVLAVLAY